MTHTVAASHNGLGDEHCTLHTTAEKHVASTKWCEASVQKINIKLAHVATSEVGEKKVIENEKNFL